MPQDDHSLRGALREEAARHHPDREAILARVERGQLPRFRFLRPAAAALAVAAVVSVVAGVRLRDSPDPGPAPASRFSHPSPVRGKGLAAAGKRDRHSLASWSQQQVTLDTLGTITQLDVTIRIARTERVADTGRWTSIPAEMVVSSVAVARQALVYRFTLKPGGTLAPGSYVFAAQFNHATSPRALSGDSYTIVTGGVTLTGGFTA